MEIAIYHNLPSGGAKRALYEWTRRLVVTHKIDVYSLSTADHAFEDIRPFVQAYRIFDFTPYRLFDKTPWTRLNRLQRWRDLNALTCLGHQIANEINKCNYDVVFAHPCHHTFIPTILQFVQIPSLYYLHEPFGPSFERHFRRPYLKENTRCRALSRRLDPFYSLYQGLLERTRKKSIKRTTRLLANSQFTQAQMKMEYDVDAPVCSYGLDTARFCPMPRIQKENFLISVGALAPRKGFDFLIESLAYLPRGIRPPLRIISNWVSPEERRYMEELAAACDVELHILTNLNTDQLALEYNKAQLCIYAPISEPLGLVPLEAMACGIPVVGVREGGIRETVVHEATGILTDRNPRCFAQAIESLLSDPARREQLGCQGRVHVEKHWQWERSTLNLERHLNSIVEQKSSDGT